MQVFFVACNTQKNDLDDKTEKDVKYATKMAQQLVKFYSVRLENKAFTL